MVNKTGCWDFECLGSRLFFFLNRVALHFEEVISELRLDMKI